MPSLEITSNVAPKDLDAFIKKASAKFADAIGKPEALCLVTFTKADQLIFGGSTEPGFIAHVYSIGNIDNVRNAGLSASISELFDSELGVKNNRGYFFLHDIPGDNTGYAGTTYTNIVAAKSK
jgi:hypothetical protein